MGRSDPLQKNFQNQTQPKTFDEEIEVKYVVDEGTWHRMQDDFTAEYGTLDARDERTNIYFDTALFGYYQILTDIRSRQTKSGNKYKFDFKTPINLGELDNQPDENGVFWRREYKKKRKDNAIKVKHLKQKHPELYQYLKSLGLKKEQIDPLIAGTFQRDRKDAQITETLKLEMAFEFGHYKTIDGQHDSDLMFIIEPEIKDGTYEEYVAYNKFLQDQYKITPSIFTKGQMGIQFSTQFMPQAKQELFAQIHNTLYPQNMAKGQDLKIIRQKKAQPVRELIAA